jgi:integrase
MEVAEIEPDDVDEYCELRRAGDLGWEDDAGKERGYRTAEDPTIRRELGALSAAIGYAVRKKRLPRAEAPIIELPEASEPKDRWLTPEEAERLLAACQPAGAARLSRVYRFCVLALEIAGRARALETLSWIGQVDFTHGIVHQNPRGRKQTKKRRSSVPMSNRLRSVLTRAFAEKTSEWVLDHKGSVRKAFEAAVDRAGLNPPKPGPNATPAQRREWRRNKVTRHTLRHTWATWAAQRGTPLWKIAGVLGDTYDTVEKNYLHHCPEHLRDAVEYHQGGRDTPAETDMATGGVGAGGER